MLFLFKFGLTIFKIKNIPAYTSIKQILGERISTKSYTS